MDLGSVQWVDHDDGRSEVRLVGFPELEEHERALLTHQARTDPVAAGRKAGLICLERRAVPAARRRRLTAARGVVKVGMWVALVVRFPAIAVCAVLFVPFFVLASLVIGPRIAKDLTMEAMGE